MPSSSDVQNSLHYVRPRTVAYVRKRGLIASAAQGAWDELRRAMQPNAMQSDAGIALLHRTGGDEVEFDACTECASVIDANVPVLPTQVIKGGVHISAAPVYAHGSLVHAIEALLNDPMIGHGLAIDLDRPAIITYVRGDGRWQLTLSAPLSWALHRDRAA